MTGANTPWYKLCTRKDIKRLLTEPYSHWQNLSEGAIREIKWLYERIRGLKQVPRRLWPNLMRHCCSIRNDTALDIPELRGKTPRQRLTGETSDVSHYVGPDDVEKCNDGSYMSRDPENNCAFKECLDEKMFCTQEVKVCPDGSYVGKDPDNGCAFRPCKGEIDTGSSIHMDIQRGKWKAIFNGKPLDYKFVYQVDCFCMLDWVRPREVTVILVERLKRSYSLMILMKSFPRKFLTTLLPLKS